MGLLGRLQIMGINPWEWLRDVLGRIPEHPVNRLEELLPSQWEAQGDDL